MFYASVHPKFSTFPKHPKQSNTGKRKLLALGLLAAIALPVGSPNRRHLYGHQSHV